MNILLSGLHVGFLKGSWRKAWWYTIYTSAPGAAARGSGVLIQFRLKDPIFKNTKTVKQQKMMPGLQSWVRGLQGPQNEVNASLHNLLRSSFKRKVLKRGVAWGYSSIVKHYLCSRAWVWCDPGVSPQVSSFLSNYSWSYYPHTVNAEMLLLGHLKP